MTIKNGFNDKPLIIQISGGFNPKTAELWVKQEGLTDKETLSYPTINELIGLRDELNAAIKKMAGV